MTAERESTAASDEQTTEQAAEDFGGDTGLRAKLPEPAITASASATYRELVDTLLDVRSNPHQPHPVARHVSALLAAWAHADANTIAEVFAQLGLPDNHCQRITVDNPALSLAGSVVVVQSKCRRLALVAYAGPDPHAPSSWLPLADAQPALVRVPHASAEARVVAQHYRNQRASWNALMAALQVPAKSAKRRARKDEGELEAIFLCGHGSAGASAALAAFRLATSTLPEEQRLAERLVQVYAFGAPMFGNVPFSRTWNDHPLLADRVFFHLHGRDVVPHLPPRGLNKLRHVGKHYAVNSGGDKWPEEPHGGPAQVSSSFDLVRALVPLLAEHTALPSTLAGRGWFSSKSISAVLGLLFKEGPTYSFYDHGAMNYLISCQPKSVHSEFGETF